MRLQAFRSIEETQQHDEFWREVDDREFQSEARCRGLRQPDGCTTCARRREYGRQRQGEVPYCSFSALRRSFFGCWYERREEDRQESGQEGFEEGNGKALDATTATGANDAGQRPEEA